MNIKHNIQKLLKSHGVRPNKLKGQHFMVHEKMLKDTTSYAEVGEGDRVVEVGAGVGNLTRELLSAGAEVFAIENDLALVEILQEELGEKNNLHIKAEDVLEFDEKNISTPYAVVGNIPYYITGPIIQKFLESPHQPERLVFTIQKEVAERIKAAAPKATFLSTIISLFADVEYKQTVSAKHFWPQPDVASATIVLTPHTSVQEVPDDLIALIHAGFTHPRKTLLNNLAAELPQNKKRLKKALKNTGLSATVRAHELTIAQWKALYKNR